MIKMKVKYVYLSLLFFAPLQLWAQTFSYAQRLILDQIVFYEDTEQPNHYYYLPNTERIALDSTGVPPLTLDRFFFKDSINKPGSSGAILQMVLDFALPPEKIQALERQMQQKRPGARILGAVPFQLSQGMSPVFSHEQRLFFEFFPPASGVLQIAMPKSDALLAQSKSFVFESILSFTYSVIFEGYAEIQKDSLAVFFHTASTDKQFKLLQFFLCGQTLNLYTVRGQKIILHEDEISAVARYLVEQFQQMLPAVYASPTHTITENQQNNIMTLKLKRDNWSHQLQYHIKAPNQKKSALRMSGIALPDSKFNTRKIYIFKDGFFEALTQIPPNLYNVDLKLAIGKRGQSPIYVKDSILYDLKKQNDYILEYPYFYDPSASPLDRLSYRYFFKHYFTLGQFNALIKEAQGANLWETQDFMAINIAPQFKTADVYIEFDHLERKSQGIQGLRVEFYHAKNKFTTSPGAANSSELESDYEPGVYLGEAVLDLSSSELFQKRLIFPAHESNWFFYKISWFLTASAPQPNGVVESKLFFNCYSGIFLDLPDLKALPKN